MNTSTIEGNATKGNANNTFPELKAFKRAPSLGLSKWENGNLTTNLAEKKDTNGAFFLVEAMLAPGTEPPPHVHSREDEFFYVLEAFEWLRVSLDNHDTGTLSLLIDPLMRGLRHDPRYSGMLVKIGLPATQRF